MGKRESIRTAPVFAVFVIRDKWVEINFHTVEVLSGAPDETRTTRIRPGHSVLRNGAF
jgi:hypothetical protein